MSPITDDNLLVCNSLQVLQRAGSKVEFVLCAMIIIDHLNQSVTHLSSWCFSLIGDNWKENVSQLLVHCLSLMGLVETA